MGLTDHAAWTAQVLKNMEGFGPAAEAALHYMRQRGTKVSLHAQPTGARWTADRRIEVHPRFARMGPDDPYAISLIIHEVRHLQQGPLTALSVYGELEAWQLQFGLIKSWTGRYHADARRRSVLEQLVSLQLGWDRQVLEDARHLMQAYAGKRYRVDLLPLYPLPDEIIFQVLRKQPQRGTRIYM
jgi:hypothetical protein